MKSKHHLTSPEAVLRRLPLWALILFAMVFLALLVLVATAPKVQAADGCGAGAYCARWGMCLVRRSWPEYSTREKCCRFCRRHGAAERVYGYERREEPREYTLSRDIDRLDMRGCRDMRRAVGNQHLTLDGARKAADEAWAGDVRFSLGELFMDLSNARRMSYTCSRSSIKEGGITTLGQTLTRCEVRAIPCPARSAPVDSSPSDAP